MQTAETVHLSANLIQKTLRLTGYNSGIGPLRPARSSDGALIQDIARQISTGEADTNDIVFTTGYGLHRSYQFPVRAPAIMLPALHVLQEMERIGLKPARYLVYQATDLIALVNGLDRDQARESSGKLERYLRGYVERYHRKVAERVSFEFGCDYDSDHSESIQNIAAEVRSKTQVLTDAATPLGKTQEYERKHSNMNGLAEIYAAANVLYSGATEEYPFRAKIPESTRLIVPVGSNAEKPFFSITSMIADARGTTRKIVPFLTPIGARPTYYPAKEAGDPMTIQEFEEAVTSLPKDGPIRSDIQAMIADGATAEGLRGIFPDEQ